MIAIMSDLYAALVPLLTHEISMPAGANLFHQGEEVRHIYVVHAGCVHLVRYTEAGATAVMQRAMAGAIVAESSIFSPRYHCDAVVIADAIVGRADMPALRQTLQDDSGLLESVTRHLAREVQRMRARVEVLSRKTVQERLDAWFALNEGALPPKGSWRSIAEDIGVSPEALYRELKRRRAN